MGLSCVKFNWYTWLYSLFQSASGWMLCALIDIIGCTFFFSQCLWIVLYTLIDIFGCTVSFNHSLGTGVDLVWFNWYTGCTWLYGNHLTDKRGLQYYFIESDVH